MIAGATYTLPLDIPYPVDQTEKIIITLMNKTSVAKITKHYPNEDETWLMDDGRIGVRLSQQDTISLVGWVSVEAQINLSSGAVAKTDTKRVYIASTLNTELVDGAADNGEVYLDGVSLEVGEPFVVVDGKSYDADAVHYTAEEKTAEEQAQARENIGVKQGDWNQSDETAVDYVKNRTHYYIQYADTESLGAIKPAVGAQMALRVVGRSGYSTLEIDNVTSEKYSTLCFTTVFRSTGTVATMYVSEMPSSRFTMIDEKNYKYGIYTNDAAYLVFIVDPSLLTGEDATLYPDAGVYVLYTNETYVNIFSGITVENRYYIKLNDRFIPSTIARTTDVSAALKEAKEYTDNSVAQPDWNQSDEMAKDYVKNRTHYDYTEEIVLTQEVTASGQTVFEGVTFDTETDYTVTLANDTETREISGRLRFVSSSSGYAGYLIAGNTTPSSAFDLYSEDGLKTVHISCIGITLPATLTVKYFVPRTKQLDEKYIPDTIARTEIVPNSATITDDGKLSMERTDDGVVTKLFEVELPSDSDEWETLLDVEMTEAVSYIVISEFPDGTPINKLQKMFVYGKRVRDEDGKGGGAIWIKNKNGIEYGIGGIGICPSTTTAGSRLFIASFEVFGEYLTATNIMSSNSDTYDAIVYKTGYNDARNAVINRESLTALMFDEYTLTGNVFGPGSWIKVLAVRDKQ